MKISAGNTAARADTCTCKTKGIVFNSVNHDLGNFLDSFSGESIDLVATLRRNTWNNEISIQLQVEDIIVS